MNAEDRGSLRELVDRYADAVDRRAIDELAALFTADGVLRVQRDDAPVESEWSGEDVARSVSTLERYHRTFHHVGGCAFDEDGAGATGRVHCVAHHYEKTPNGPVDLVMFVVYHDRYRRDGTAWRFAERRVAVQWTELHPAHPMRRQKG